MFRAEEFFARVEAVRPTYCSAVPAIYAMLAALPADTAPDTSSLRRVICGAAPMSAELIARFEGRYGVPIVEGYGLSEGTCASTINPPPWRKPGTVGLPLPGQQVALMGPDGQLVDGGSGEVAVRGPNVMRGYLNRPGDLICGSGRRLMLVDEPAEDRSSPDCAVDGAGWQAIAGAGDTAAALDAATLTRIATAILIQ